MESAARHPPLRSSTRGVERAFHDVFPQMLIVPGVRDLVICFSFVGRLEIPARNIRHGDHAGRQKRCYSLRLWKRKPFARRFPFPLGPHLRDRALQVLAIRVAPPQKDSPSFRPVLEPPEPGQCLSKKRIGGRCRIRTYDFHRVKMALYR